MSRIGIVTWWGELLALGVVLAHCGNGGSSSPGSSGSSESSSGGAASSSSSSGAGADGGPSYYYCATPADASTPTCTTWENVAPAYTSEIQRACAAEGLEMTQSCPSAGIDGCCKTQESGIPLETCFYDLTDAGAAFEAKQCTQGLGTWSPTP
jgi:hypothetical protein